MGYQYYLPDGTSIGNGAVSNANPYAHFTYNYQDILTGHQGVANCTIAASSYKYDQYKGSPSDYLQMQNSNLYSSSAANNK